MLHVRLAQPRGVPRGQVVSLWRIPGRKRLMHGGADLILCAQDGPSLLRASLSPALADGQPCRFSIPLGMDAAPCHAQLRLVAGERSAPAFRRVARSHLLHVRCLQALDAQQAGLGQRDVAQVLFGASAVTEHWHADSDLRAQVRHILARGRAWMNGGYLQLAGVRPA